MAFTNQTTHYGLPQWIGSDKPTYLVDQNNAYQKIDSEIYNANVAAGEAVTTANGASATAGAASATAADALSAAQTASTTADSALAAAQDAGTIAQAAQTAAGAAQTAAEAAQQAAAGNSITNLAPAYDSTITYAIDDLVTQDGKLYKCIVAVTTPEQFDINKWDDVTTSEVYLRQSSVETRLKKVGMNDNSNFTFSNANDYVVLESRADNGKVRAILFDVRNNILKLRKSDDSGATFTDSQLYPTITVGQTINIKIDSFASVTDSNTVWIPVQSPAFIDGNVSDYSITLNYCSIAHKAGTPGDYPVTSPTAALISMRKDCALVSVTSSEISAESYTVNTLVRTYIDINITRNN